MDTTGDSKDILTAPANEAYQPEFSAAEVAAYDELIDVGGRLHDIAERTGRESYRNAQFDCGVLMAAVTLIDSGVAGDYPGKVREIERRIINRIRYALESVSPAAGREISAPTPDHVARAGEPDRPSSAGEVQARAEHALPWTWEPAERDGDDVINGATLRDGNGRTAFDVDCGDYCGFSDERAAMVVARVNGYDALRERAEAAEATVKRQKGEAERQTANLRRDIDQFWLYVESAYAIEPRSFFEKEAPTNGFGSPLAQAAHHIWKRDPQVKALESQVHALTAQLKQKEQEMARMGNLT